MNRGFNVNVEVKTNIVNAFMYFKESITNNELTFVKYPMGWSLKYVKVDGIEYEIDFNISSSFNTGIAFRNTNTNRMVTSEKKYEVLKETVNDISNKGAEYLNSLYNCNFKYEI